MDPNLPLLSLDNVIIYPHIGGNTTEAAHRASYFAAMGVEEVYEGKKPDLAHHEVDYATAPTYTDTKKPDKKACQVVRVLSLQLLCASSPKLFALLLLLP